MLSPCSSRNHEVHGQCINEGTLSVCNYQIHPSLFTRQTHSRLFHTPRDLNSWQVNTPVLLTVCQFCSWTTRILFAGPFSIVNMTQLVGACPKRVGPDLSTVDGHWRWATSSFVPFGVFLWPGPWVKEGPNRRDRPFHYVLNVRHAVKQHHAAKSTFWVALNLWFLEAWSLFASLWTSLVSHCL